MLNLREKLLEFFGAGDVSAWKRANQADCEKKTYESSETGSKYHLVIKLTGQSCPEFPSINKFLNEIEPWDEWGLHLQNEDLRDYENGVFLAEGEARTPYACINPDEDQEPIDYFESEEIRNKYQAFSKSYDKAGILQITLDINKKMTNDNVCSVYEWDAFAEFLMNSESVSDSAGVFTGFLNNAIQSHPEGINFLVHDAEADYMTDSFSLADDRRNFVRYENRNAVLEKYNDASLTMGLTKNYLLPGDFHVNEPHDRLPSSRGDEVKECMRRYETVYCLAFLAAASWFDDGALVMQLEKGGKAFRLPVGGIAYNRDIYKLTCWAFDERDAAERAEIAREIISRYCADEGQILNIDESLRRAARSSYKLYTKKAVERYIKYRKELGDGIAKSVKQIQDLIVSLEESMSKNFIAVITVIISQVLANHVDWEKFASGVFIKASFKPVVIIFTIASFAYLITSLYSVYTKWTFYSGWYYSLKEQYEDILDEKELESAFDNDSLINKATADLKKNTFFIGLMWAFLNTLVLVSGYLSKYGWAWYILPLIVFVIAIVYAYKSRTKEDSAEGTINGPHSESIRTKL